MTPNSESIVFISEHGNSLPIALDLQSEGVPCGVYVHEPVYRSLYSNMMPRISLEDLPGRIKAATHVVIDMVRPNNEEPEDLDFFKMFGLNPRALGVFGAFSDKLRRQYPDKTIINGGRFPERVELNREEGFALARRLGFKIPEYHKFNSLKEGAKFLHSGPGKGRRWVIKPNGNVPLDLTYTSTFKNGEDILDLLTHVYPARFGTDEVEYLLQIFIEEGVELSSAIIFDKGRIVSANRTFESKKFIEGDKGPNVGSASNTVWQCKDAEGIVHKEMQGLLPYIGDLRGEADANCIITKNGDLNFLEWTMFRMGLDAIYCQMAQIKPGQRALWWIRGFKAKYRPGFAASQRLTLWPAPRVKTESDRKEIRGNLINHPLKDLKGWWLEDVQVDAQGKLRVAGADGLVGVVTAVGDTMEEAIAAVQKECEQIEVVGNRQWRTDHAEKHLERMEKLRKWGIQVF
jgi:hypothetical protein